MPNIDLTAHKCAWCGHADDGVRLCNSCMMYSCRDCKLGVDEAGCFHKKKEIPVSRNWNESPSDFKYLLPDPNSNAKLSMLQEMRLQDS